MTDSGGLQKSAWRTTPLTWTTDKRVKGLLAVMQAQGLQPRCPAPSQPHSHLETTDSHPHSASPHLSWEGN